MDSPPGEDAERGVVVAKVTVCSLDVFASIAVVVIGLNDAVTDDA